MYSNDTFIGNFLKQIKFKIGFLFGGGFTKIMYRIFRKSTICKLICYDLDFYIFAYINIKITCSSLSG